MFRDPFDEFRRLEKLIQKVLETGYPMGASKGGVFIRKSGGKTEIDVRGDVPNSTIKRLKRKYPNAEVPTESKKEKVPRLHGIVAKEVEEPETEEHLEKMDPEKLALNRFREKKEGRQREGSPAGEGESG